MAKPKKQSLNEYYDDLNGPLKQPLDAPLKGPQGVELDDLVDGMVAVQQFQPGVVRLVFCGQG